MDAQTNNTPPSSSPPVVALASAASVSQTTSSLVETIKSVTKSCGLHAPPFVKKDGLISDSAVLNFANQHDSTLRSLFEMFSTSTNSSTNSPAHHSTPHNHNYNPHSPSHHLQTHPRRSRLTYSNFFRSIISCSLHHVGVDLRSNFCLVRIFLASVDDPLLIQKDSEEKKDDETQNASTGNGGKKQEQGKKNNRYKTHSTSEIPLMNLKLKSETLRNSFTALVPDDLEEPLHSSPALVRQLLATVEDNPLPGQFSLLMHILEQEAKANGWGGSGGK